MEEKGFRLIEDYDLRPGVRIMRDGVHFGVYAQERPSLVLYRKGTQEIVEEIAFPEQERPGLPYTMKVKLAPGGYEYNYRIGGRIVTDPYAVRIVGREQFGAPPEDSPHAVRGGFITKKFDWKGDRLPQIPYEDAVMYHLHVRGFTMQKNSGVRRKGTFAGLTEKLPYLASLGVNQLKLMPAYEFSEWMKPEKAALGAPKTQEEAMKRALEPEAAQESSRMNFWGYGGGFYFAPKASYSASGRPEEEFRELVRACHARGIEVLLEFAFGDEVDLPMISDCLNYWADTYHVDGFSVIARDSLTPEIARLPLFRARKLLCCWYPDYIKTANVERKSLIAETNDGFMNDCRRMLKGEEQSLGPFGYRLRQNPPGCGQINYMTNHDGFTLLDLVSYDCKHNDANGERGRDGTDYNYSWNCGVEGVTAKREILRMRMRQRKNAFAMLFFSQGTPMLLAGDELGNSQEGNNNPYCHDSELTWTDWSRARSNRELTQFVRDAAAFRAKHRMLHQKAELKCADRLSSGFPDLSYHGEKAWFGDFDHMKRHLGCMYSGSYAGEDGFLYIAWNFHWDAQQFALPQLPKKKEWFMVMDTSQKQSFLHEDAQTALGTAKLLTVPGRTVVVLEGR